MYVMPYVSYRKHINCNIIHFPVLANISINLYHL